jgi:hypothetical protein
MMSGMGEARSVLRRSSAGRAGTEFGGWRNQQKRPLSLCPKQDWVNCAEHMDQPISDATGRRELVDKWPPAR